MFSLRCRCHGDEACFDVDALFQVFAVYYLSVVSVFLLWCHVPVF